MSVNQRVEELIKSLNLTPNAFAIRLGIKPTIIYNIIKGRNKPGYDLIEKIANTFFVNPGILFASNEAENTSNDVHPIVHPIVPVSTPNKENNKSGVSDFEQAGEEFLDRKNRLRKVKTVFKIHDLYNDFDKISGLVYEYQDIIGHYDIQTQIDLITRNKGNKISFQDLSNQLVKPVENFKELIKILLKYKDTIDELHAEIITFNNQHDKYNDFDIPGLKESEQ